jgi:GT2 family glycosyltransferase
MQLSVIIVNYNVRAFLENALISVRKAIAGIPGELFVVDNASDDGSVEMLRQKFPDVKLIVNPTNRGFAAANNQALRESGGKYVLFLNPDTIVQEDTFRVMLEFMEQHESAAMAGCKILNPDGSLQLGCHRSTPTPWVAFTRIIGLSTLFPRFPFFSRYNLTYLDPDETHRVDAVSGSFMLVRRSAIDQVGGMDEQFFMYGEDLDWCYRFAQAGWEIYYVPATQIIHYKGESARRSDIDEVRLFYEAMRVFVRKHFPRGIFSDVILRLGIGLREWVAFFGKNAKPLFAFAADVILVDCSLLLSEYIWFGQFFKFPASAYPVTLTIPPLVVASVIYGLGGYTDRKLAVSRSAGAVVVGYMILSALTFFFKQYGFSRMVVAISGAISVLLIPGWRIAARVFLRSPVHRRRSLFGRRTVIVGAGESGQEVLRKLRARIADGYEIVGFIDKDRRRVGEKVSGLEILGSIDNIGKVIAEHRASEVIFSTDILSYADILSVIGRSRSRAVNFRLVPSSMEVMIGKTHIDVLDDIPLVDIDYKIDWPARRLVKRLFDLVCSLVLLATAYPVVALRRRAGSDTRRAGRKILMVPRVLRGALSMVGPPEYFTGGMYLGKPGLTGLVQINYHDDLAPEEIEKYNLYYAKNQSLVLDVEILLKTLIILLREHGKSGT